MSAHPRGLTLRATLISLALGAALYVAAISGVIAYQIAPRATAIRQQSAKLHAEFEASSERAAALKSAIAETRDLVARRVAPEKVESLRAKVQSQVDSAGAVQNIGVLSDISGEMRISLGQAAEAESQLGAAIIEALAEVELNRYTEAETKLTRCDTLQTIIAGRLNEAQRFGLIDLIQREKSLSEAAGSAIKMIGWWVAIGVALIPAFALLVQHRFYRPLAELDRGLARVAGGNIETTVEIHRQDELGRLSQHFNRMTDVLRQRAEEERRHAHGVTERFGRILDESSNEIYIFDAETYHFLQVNRGARENLGYTEDEFSGLTPLDLMPEFDRASFDELAALMHAGQREMAMITTVHRRKDGTTYPVEVNIQISRRETPTVLVSIVRDITERKQMEEALRKSEEQFRLAIDAAQMGTWDWNLVTNHIRRTGRAYQLFGVTQELLGDTSSTFLDRIHPLDREHIRQAIRRAITDGALYSEEFRIMLPDGSVRWRAAQGTTFRDGEGRATRMVGVVLDITERKQAEEALRASEQRFAKAFNASPNPISIATLQEGRIIDVNDAFLREFGGAREELIGRTATEIAIWVSSEAHARTVRALYHKGSVRDIEAEFRMKDGEIHLCSCSAEVIELDGQQCALFQSSDITERKRMEEALRDSEAMFRTLTETITMAIYIYRGNRYLYVNSAAEKITGYTRDELLAMDLLTLVHDEDKDRLMDYAQKRQRGEAAPTRYEMRSIIKSGTVRWFDVSIAQIDYKGEPAYLVTAFDITERKQAEAALRESEERFFKAFNASPMSMGINRLTDGAYIDANEAALRESGFSHEELLGKTPEELGIWIDPEDRLKMASIIRERGNIREFEIRHKRKSGEERVSLMSAEIIETGGERCLLTTAFDITERKQAEAALMESEERFSKAFQASPLAMSISATGDNCIIAANESFLRMHDFSRQEIVGHTAEEVELWIDSKEREDFIRRTIEQGEVRDVEAAVRTRGGENLIVLLSGVLIELGGEPCVLFTGSDITERKRAERALQKSERRFRALIENSFDVIIMFDADGKILYTSPSIKRVFGYDADEWVGRIGIGLIHPDEVEEGSRIFAEAALKPGTVAKVVNRILHKNGSYRTVQVIGTNLLDEPGVEAVVSNLRDITEQVQAEEEIRRLNEELEHRVAERTAQLEAVNRELEAFSYSVSHDLRAPLRSINGFSLALMEDCASQLGKTGLDYLARVRAASQRMGQLIDDLLNLSRITRSDMHREKVDLSALAHSVAMDIQSADSAREVEFRIAPDLMAEADPRLLHVALENLLGNSWKFTEKTARAEIEFGSARDQGETVFFVRDNGAGFDMAYADKLFGAFQRLHSMTEFKGTGIGLATVQRIINRHGGRIWAEGEVGKGATFYFTLP